MPNLNKKILLNLRKIANKIEKHSFLLRKWVLKKVDQLQGINNIKKWQQEHHLVKESNQINQSKT